MNEIFISYAKGDRPRAAELAAVLEAQGWPVWWDRHIPPGRTFDEVIEEALSRASCVIVLWSAESVASRWVRAEASMAAERGVFVPALIEDVALPLEFRRVQAADLIGWSGDPDTEGLHSLIETARKYVRGGAAPTPTPPPLPRRRRPPAVPLRTLARAAAALVVVAAIAFFGLRSDGDRVTSEPNAADAGVAVPAEPRSDGATPAPPAAEASREAPPVENVPAGAFEIKIGDTVSDGVPQAGAGDIAEPFEHDVYVFSAAPRQRVYFRPVEQSPGVNWLWWRLVDGRDMEVFNQYLGGEPGVQTLVRGGTYRLTVGSKDNRSTGLYSFRLYNVPAPQRFAIRIGSTVREGMPGPGAGYLESPGVQDVYSFTATPRQKVHFRPVSQSAGIRFTGWRLVDDEGVEIFSAYLGGDPGVQTLTKGGTYTLTVGNNTTAQTGTYEFEIAEAR